MYTSGNNQNPFSYPTEIFFKQPYTYDENPILAQEEPQYIINFTSPFLDDHELPLSQILPQQQPLAIHADVVCRNENTQNSSARMGKNSSTEMVNEAPIDQPKPCEVKTSRKRNLGTMPRKRTGKKDRHSKICTAQGIRDRRMRLSLQIARKFFDLQDMLGFDKASKTIEWLFSKSKKAIKELTENVPQSKDSSSSKENSESFMSECEVESGMEEDTNNEGRKGMAARDATLVDDPYEKENRKLPKVASNFHHARESRDKARARARERTREKMRIKGFEKTKQLYVSSPNNLDQLGSFSHFETLEESTSCTKKSSSHEGDSNSDGHQFANVGITENYLGTENFTQIACPFFSYQNTELSHVIDFDNSFLGFLGNWDNNGFRINSSNDANVNMVSLAGNPASTCLATSKFPFNLQ